jgi:protein involved in polysaccharide export with SLBB domain
MIAGATLLLGVCAGPGVPSSAAQTLPEEGEDTYVHRYARAGRATITVYVWGQVDMPGIWRVEPETGLVELLSAARVPGVGTDQPQVRRRTVLRIYRAGEGDRRKVFDRSLEQIVTTAADAPPLQEGDVVEVKETQNARLTFRDVIGYVGTAASLTLLVLRIINQS